jgi:hypothetical protein
MTFPRSNMVTADYSQGNQDFAPSLIPAEKPYVAVFGSGIPFVVCSSGNLNNTAGNITVATAFDNIMGPSYTFFPAGVLFPGAAAGWYYMVWTAATIGTVYRDVYINGNPQIPVTPTPITTNTGAFTQSVGFDIPGPTFVVPAGALGNNGCIEWNKVVYNNGGAGAKSYGNYFGGQLFQGLSQTTNPKAALNGTLKNRGRKTAQIAANASFGDNNAASANPVLTVDSGQSQVFSMTLNTAVATDFAVLESYFVRVTGFN